MKTDCPILDGGTDVVAVAVAVEVSVSACGVAQAESLVAAGPSRSDASDTAELVGDRSAERLRVCAITEELLDDRASRRGAEGGIMRGKSWKIFLTMSRRASSAWVRRASLARLLSPIRKEVFMISHADSSFRSALNGHSRMRRSVVMMHMSTTSSVMESDGGKWVLVTASAMICRASWA
jgi:hypothetical protein